jgi:ribonuclease D
MLEYAAGDTSHLHQLREQLRSDLEAKGRLSWAEEEFLLTEQIRSAPPPEEGEGFFRLKGAKALDRRAMAILRELYEWREATAASLDRASFRVMGNEVLFALAEKPVTTIAELGQVRGVGRDVAERRGAQVVAAITKALELPEDQLPKVVRPPRRAPDLEYEARVDALKKVRNALAEEYGLQPGVLCPNGILEGIAREMPRDAASLERVPGIRRWQVREIGDRLMAALPEMGQTE